MSLKNLYPNKPCRQGCDMKLLCASPAIRKCGTYKCQRLRYLEFSHSRFSAPLHRYK